MNLNTANGDDMSSNNQVTFPIDKVAPGVVIDNEPVRKDIEYAQAGMQQTLLDPFVRKEKTSVFSDIPEGAYVGVILVLVLVIWAWCVFDDPRRAQTKQKKD
ncbi:hypothetical protein [Ferrovibrio sp.]|uniref:hypothetical protein n=1 Tax=Ferrovibrio sp. TaxID=1917215 RepID=UPI003D2C0AD3